MSLNARETSRTSGGPSSSRARAWSSAGPGGAAWASARRGRATDRESREPDSRDQPEDDSRERRPGGAHRSRIRAVPDGVLLLLTNKDRPGIVGYLGTLLGRHNVNIASMSLSRDIAGGHALTVLNLDSVPSAAVLEELQKDPDISNVRVVKL